MFSHSVRESQIRLGICTQPPDSSLNQVLLLLIVILGHQNALALLTGASTLTNLAINFPVFFFPFPSLSFPSAKTALYVVRKLRKILIYPIYKLSREIS